MDDEVARGERRLLDRQRRRVVAVGAPLQHLRGGDDQRAFGGEGGEQRPAQPAQEAGRRIAQVAPAGDLRQGAEARAQRAGQRLRPHAGACERHPPPSRARRLGCVEEGLLRVVGVEEAEVGPGVQRRVGLARLQHRAARQGVREQRRRLPRRGLALLQPGGEAQAERVGRVAQEHPGRVGGLGLQGDGGAFGQQVSDREQVARAVLARGWDGERRYLVARALGERVVAPQGGHAPSLVQLHAVRRGVGEGGEDVEDARAAAREPARRVGHVVRQVAQRLQARVVRCRVALVQQERRRRRGGQAVQRGLGRGDEEQGPCAAAADLRQRGEARAAVGGRRASAVIGRRVGGGEVDDPRRRAIRVPTILAPTILAPTILAPTGLVPSTLRGQRPRGRGEAGGARLGAGDVEVGGRATGGALEKPGREQPFRFGFHARAERAARAGVGVAG